MVGVGEYEVVVMANALTKAIPVAVVISCHGYVYPGVSVSSTSTIRDIDALSINLSENLRSGIGNNPEILNSMESFATDVRTTTDYVAQFDRFFDVTLNPMEVTCLESFTIPYANLLHSVSMELDGAMTGGSSAFVFAVIVTTPNGETLQIGGYQQLYSTSRAWFRLWPVQWTGGAAGAQDWSAIRNLNAAGIAQAGEYEVCISLMHKSWSETYYKGSVTFNFVNEAQSAPSPTPGVDYSNEGQMPRRLGGASLFFVVFALGFIAALGVLLVLRKKQSITENGDTNIASRRSLVEFQHTRQGRLHTMGNVETQNFTIGSISDNESDVERNSGTMSYDRSADDDNDDRRLIVGSMSSSL